jgi:thymidylate synthase
MKKHPEYQYLDLMQDIIKEGDKQSDADTGHITYSLFGRQIRFDLSQGLPLLTTKKVYWNAILHELHWFLSGQTNIKYLIDNKVHIWDDYPFRIYNDKREVEGWPELTKEEFIKKIASDTEYASKHGELPRIYGEMWRRWPCRDGNSVDQLQWVINEIKKDPSCHNAIVTSWNPEYLYAMAKPGEACRFPICHNMYQVNIKNGKLCLQLYQRSADIFLGVPFNIASYALLTEILAKITGYEAGEFVHTFGDVHIYETHLDQAKEQLSREPLPLPRIEINEAVKSLESFKPECVSLIDYVSHPPIKAEMAVVGGFNHKLHSQDKNQNNTEDL